MTRTVRLRDLSRGQQRTLAEASGEVAEEIVAEGDPSLRHRPDETDWYDVVHDATGTKIEVKSTWTEIGEQYPAGGRFRLRRDQLRSLTSSASAGSSGTAWVAFVLFDEDTGTATVQRRSPSTVRGYVEDAGGWNRAGHAEFEWQSKVPYSRVIDAGDLP